MAYQYPETFPHRIQKLTPGSPPQEFHAATRRMKKPDLRPRWRGFWHGMPSAPYAAVWRDETICAELEISAVRLQDTLSLLFFGEQDQVQKGDQIELISIEPRRREISLHELIFTKIGGLPVGAIWATDWIKNALNFQQGPVLGFYIDPTRTCSYDLDVESKNRPLPLRLYPRADPAFPPSAPKPDRPAPEASPPAPQRKNNQAGWLCL